MPTEPDTIRYCSKCGSISPAGEPCLPCALAGTLLDDSETPSEPEMESERRAFDPTVLPTAFGRYEVRKEIAIGGMGAVYEAYDTRLSRTVALKLMRSLLLSTPEEKARFHAEAGAVAQLDHPNIVPIFEVGEESGQPYFTMKLIDGVSLATRLRDGPLPARDAAKTMATVARAVAHAHQRDVLHRDLKPANILLDRDGQPWLTDFGLAKLTTSDSDLTRTGASLGTPEYMSPEQAGGRVREISAASDVWALGIVLCQMLTGKLPFRGDSHAEVFRQIIGSDGRVEGAKELGSSVPPDLSTIVSRCLQKEPADRPPTALYLAEELERWLAGQPILSRPVSKLERAMRWLRRHPWPVTAMVAGILALVGMVYGLTRHQSDAHGAEVRNTRTTVTEHPREFAHPVFGSDGMLFGTSAVGGKYGHGGVYRLHPDTPDEAEAITYYSGPRDEVGAIAGSGPSRLVPVGGELFGVTRYGGSKGGGTIFRISSEGRAETVHGLDDASNGHHPMSLMLASDGWLWGGLEEGGAAGKGGVFRFHPGTLRYELMFSCSGPDDPVKSGFACRGVFEARSGYFLFAAGGWEIGSRRAIFSFQGAGPAKLVHVFPEMDAPGDVGDIRGFATSADGKIYFITELGGENDIGTIQRLNLDGSPPVVVHQFKELQGARPHTDLIVLPNGRFCGATTAGGAYGQGAIFAFSPPSEQRPDGEFTRLANLHHHSDSFSIASNLSNDSLFGSFHELNSRDLWIVRCDPNRPGPIIEVARFQSPMKPVTPGPPAKPGRLVHAGDGEFFGVCSNGGAHGHGTLFRWVEGSEPETLAHFTGASGEVVGSYPIGQLALGSDDALYGMTRLGGGTGVFGTVFRFDPASRDHRHLASLEGLGFSAAGMEQGPHGALFGTASFGGAAGCGSIFKVTPPTEGNSAQFEIVAEFTGVGGTLPGTRPGGLTAGPEGTLYGVTHRGSVYRINTDGVHSLGALEVPGDHPAPNCLLALTADDWLYGLPTNGKNFTLFRFQPHNRTTETISEIEGSGWGYTGWCGLVNDGRGGFLTVSGNLGAKGFGGIFRLKRDGRFEVVAEFSGQDGALPGETPIYELLPVGEDFYGSCQEGGVNGRGVLFKLTAEGDVSTLVQF